MTFPDRQHWERDPLETVRLYEERFMVENAVVLMRPVLRHIQAGDLVRAERSLVRAHNWLVRYLQVSEDEAVRTGFMADDDRLTDPRKRSGRRQR